jgi:hypothetical protein
MKRKNLIFVMLLVLSALYTMQSCKKESPVGFTEEQAFTIPTLVAPTQGFIDVTGTTVDLKWASTNAAGAANKWNVYFGTGDDPALYQTAVTTQTLTVPVTVGQKYQWKVVGTDANGITTVSPIWSFEVVDSNAPLDMSMTWTTGALAAIGLDLAPTAAVDLRLLIRKADKTSQVTINATGFEDYAKWNTLPDGKYYIATDIFATVDAGDFNSPIPISINLTFKQRGTLSEVEYFTNVLTNQFVCTTYRVYLGYLVKAGSTYTFTKEVTYPVSAFSGTWQGLDSKDFEYPSEVVTYQGCSLQIKGLAFGWMSDYWGEVIFKGGSASITINSTTGVVTIPNQFYCRTRYNGAVQPDYYIQGTGTYDATGAFPTMTITYDLLQNGVSMAAQDKLSKPKFVATLTLNPAGLKRLGNTVHFTTPAVKPAH